MASNQVVVGYDGSASGRLALDWAITEARGRGLSLLIAYAGYVPTPTIAGFVTLVEPDPDQLFAGDEQLLKDAAERARAQAPDVEVATTLVPGAPATVLVDLMAGAALGVVGSRGHGTFDALLVGSTSLHLAAHASCPLVVVRPPAVEAGPEAGRVVVGVDGSRDATAALDFAFQEAAFRGCGLTAVFAWQLPHVESDGWLTSNAVLSVSDDEVTRALAESLSGWAERYPEVAVVQRVVRGEPVGVLVGASAGAELVVVGSRGLGGFRSLLFGSVGHGVLHHAYSPVAVIRAPNS
jgi:nucleotide-binding universal stress UspA family protein